MLHIEQNNCPILINRYGCLGKVITLQTEPQRRLEAVAAVIQKRFGADALRPLSELHRAPALPTEFAELDVLLGGGLPRGQISVLEGSASSGRTTLAQRIVARVQRDVAFVPYFDVGCTFDGETAAQCGIDLERLLLVRSEDRQVLVELLGALITLRISPIVLDAGAAGKLPLLPARLSTQLAQANAILLVLSPFGNQRTNRAATRLQVEHVSWLQRGTTDVSGCRSRVTVLENRFASPGGSVILDLYFGEVD